MAPHSSTLAWKIPWMEEPGRLQSMGSLRVKHDRATSFHFSLSCIGEGNGNPWQPTPVFLPGESQGQGSLVGCHLWGRTESDTTEATQQQQEQRRGTERRQEGRDRGKDDRQGSFKYQSFSSAKKGTLTTSEACVSRGTSGDTIRATELTFKGKTDAENVKA